MSIVEKYITKKELALITKNLGKQITRDYKNIFDDLIVIGILKGCLVFMSDLIRQIKLPMQIDFMLVSSYKENKKEYEKIVLDLNTSIYNKHVLVVEDIVDTGKTFSKILNLLRSRKPKSIKTCVLLNKKECRLVEEQIDYCGIEIPNIFVFGYGLDNKQKQRNLPYICCFKQL